MSSLIETSAVISNGNQEQKPPGVPSGVEALAVAFLLEIPAAVLVVVEIGILFASIVFRYVLHRPLVWSDELASTLFVWLAMLGAVIAHRRGVHMRMSALANAVSKRWASRLDAFSNVLVLTFLVVCLIPAWEYTVEESAMTTPALEMSGGIKVAALPLGLLAMSVISVCRIVCNCRPKDVLASVLLISAVGFAFWISQPTLIAIGNYNLIVVFVVIIGICVAASIPVAFAFGVATLLYIGLITDVPFNVVPARMLDGMTHSILLSIPLFVVLGVLISITGIADAMLQFLSHVLGRFRGGLMLVLLGAMYLVSGISGSKSADMAAVAPALFPEMKKRGSSPGELVALLAASGAMSETIPPSIVLLTLGSVTGVSIASLFTGGLLPALVLALILASVAVFRARKEIQPTRAKAVRFGVLRLFVVAVPALALPFVIRAAVTEGVATATEVATIGIIYSSFVGIVIYGRFDWRRIYPMLVGAASLSGAILFIIGTATAMAWTLTQSGFSDQLVHFVTHLGAGKFGFLVASIVLFVVLGSVLEGIPAIVVFAPLLFPAAKLVGVNEVHYAMVVILSMGVGLFAPPFGIGFYSACAIGEVEPDEAARSIWVYIVALVAGLVIVAAVPSISTVFLK